MAGDEVTVIVPFPTTRVLLGMSKLQVLKLMTSFTCGPVPETYVLVVTVSVHEPKTLVPVAVLLVDESTKFVALLKKARVVDTFAKA